MATAIKRFIEDLTGADLVGQRYENEHYSFERAEKAILERFDEWKNDYRILSANLERVVDGCGAGSLDLEESPRYVIMKVIYDSEHRKGKD